jgi:hypothetical protein
MGDAATTTVLTDDQATDQTTDAAAVEAAQKILDSDDASDEDKAAAQATVDAADKTGTDDKDVAPDTYADFTVPEGITLDEATLAEATPLFKELGLTQEQAQKLVDFQAKQVQAGSQKQSETFNQLMKDWTTQSENDKEFGGDKYQENVKVALNAINKFGNPELKQLMEDHGIGNNPEMIRFMWKVGKTLKEDVPDTTGSPTTKAKDRVSILYPNSNSD